MAVANAPAEQDEPDLTERLYALGRSLGFGLAHVRHAIERAKKPERLLKRWQRLATEEVRYLGWPSSGRGDYVPSGPVAASEKPGLDRSHPNGWFLSMRDEPEPVDDGWLKRFAEAAR